MNDGQMNIGGGKGNGVVFLFGALFSVITNFASVLLDHIFEAAVGGMILILFRVIGDEIEVWLKKQYQKFKGFWRALRNNKHNPPRDDDNR